MILAFFFFTETFSEILGKKEPKKNFDWLHEFDSINKMFDQPLHFRIRDRQARH